MSKWSADSLTAGYPRCVVGYDLRAQLQTLGTTRTKRVGKNIREGFFATIDSQVWQRKVDPSLVLEENGLNLFDGPLDKIINSQLPQDSVLVAFDLPVAFVDKIASTFGIISLPVELLAQNENWKLLGYDIVDARTQSSGIYSFDWSEAELAAILKRLSVNLNKNGLVDDELLGIKAAKAFDLMVKEHAPFAPCGVWLNLLRQSQR